MMPFVARLAYLGLLDVWIAERPGVQGWWARAQAWPSFKTGLSDLITPAEFAEMKRHGPGIRDAVAAHLEQLRRLTAQALDA